MCCTFQNVARAGYVLKCSYHVHSSQAPELRVQCWCSPLRCAVRLSSAQGNKIHFLPFSLDGAVVGFVHKE